MTRLVIDASVAVKWVVTEEGTADAVSLLSAGQLAAPDLLMAECADILWQKVARSELDPDEAVLAARLLQQADIELYPMRSLLEPAAQIAIDLNHPAYDCIYLALAMTNGWRLVTTDARLISKAREAISRADDLLLSLEEAAAGIGKRH
ncbi:type II toxin-antitoxin system VapC family toxin [Sphingobium sp.]|uniref:type II toxin-antitoxin system VapC family toxin n=1 Tax=Sphingobium sp. TaxID=1912891 RepID=UPI001A339175|nr:type II toxin-antitoxin system VapC family toxin [Sphingobium sp.]MBJ7378530.1 type II toxin-antitoxin system VapC family toxin [Sphingobium sp.]